MDLNKEYTIDEIQNINFVVDAVTYEPRYVPNQNVDSSTVGDDLQYEDISFSNVQFELPNPSFSSFNTSLQINNDDTLGYNDSPIDLPNELYCPQSSDINVQYSTVTTTTFNQDITKNIPMAISPVLSITKQPKKLHRFRYIREINNESHGYLLGTDSAGRNLKTFVTVELQMPPNLMKDDKYFIRCTLHQPLPDVQDVESSRISPNMLCCRKTKESFTNENELFPMVQVDDATCNNNYQFKLENFLIIRPKQQRVAQNCREKYELLRELDSSRLRLMMPDNEMDLKQVQIGFEVFKLTPNRNYAHVIGPIFSHCITNGEPIKVTRICNLNGDINGGTEVTLLVKGYDSKVKISVEIDDAKGWHESIDVNNNMVHANAAITFVTPKYNNEHNQNVSKITCEIRLKREMDGEHSNVQYFIYTRSLKRSFDASYQNNDEAQCKVKKPESVIAPKRRAFMENEGQYQTDSVAEVKKQTLVTHEPVSSENPLDYALHQICYLYNKAQNVGFDNKSEYSALVRQHFKYYEQESSCNSSILHDILQMDNYQSYEMKVYKIIQYFELKDLICDSKNIFGETPLMYACIYKKPRLVRALINMGCRIQAKGSHDGNNVLHLISQQKSDIECRKIFMEAIKATQSKTIITDFVTAMKDHNLNGLTPLHVAVMYDDKELVTEFLRFCKKIGALDVTACEKLSDGNTILHQAVLNNSTRMYRCIRKYVSDYEILNLQNYSGITVEEIIQNMEEPSVDYLVNPMAAVKLV